MCRYNGNRCKPAVPHRPRLNARVPSGKPPRVICEVASTESFRASFLPSHGQAGVARVLLGSVAESVVQDAPCAVLVVKPGRSADGGFDATYTKLRPDHLLVAYDHRRGSRRALAAACAMARRANAGIMLVRVLEPDTTGPITETPPRDPSWVQRHAGSIQSPRRSAVARAAPNRAARVMGIRDRSHPRL